MCERIGIARVCEVVFVENEIDHEMPYFGMEFDSLKGRRKRKKKNMATSDSPIMVPNLTLKWKLKLVWQKMLALQEFWDLVKTN